MIRKSLLLGFLITIYGVGYSLAQSKVIDPELYKANTIPDSLKQNANSVVRYSIEDDIVKAPGKMQSSFHRIVTILNEKGKNEALLTLPFQHNHINVNSVEMIVYDADGKQIKKYHKGDMYDRSASDDETLATDERVLYLEHIVTAYPVTIETIYDVQNSSLIDLGSWSLQHFEQSIQNSYYSFTINADAGFRYLNKNTKIVPAKTTANWVDNYFWTCQNVKAIKPEPGAVAWAVLPQIWFAMDKFEFYGRPGSLQSWQDYGKWQLDLNSDVDTLPTARQQAIKQMVANLHTDKERARFLYNYLQKSTRYISIQLGIGGFKPLPASFVDQKKYGDCKALSNYMYALLRAVNIPAYYTIVRAGNNEESANDSFPFDNFNHIILCIPFKNDTTWLECTSNTQPFGVLGSFTENRKALLVTPNGGKLVNTPKSTSEENKMDSEVHLKLNPDGSAIANIKLLASGEYRSLLIGVQYDKTDDQKVDLINFLNLKQPNFIQLTPGKDTTGIKEFNIEADYDKFYDIAAGDKQFYRPKAFDIWQATLPPAEKRKSDYYFDFPMQKTCVTTVDLPDGFDIETMPANTSLKFTFGNFNLSYAYNAEKNQLVSTAKFIVYNHVIPAAKYTELQQYLNDVVKALNKKLVLKRKA